MIIKYQIDIDKDIILKSLNRITNQIFKILPMREEGGEWQSTLKNLIVELTGMHNLFSDQIDLFVLLCKMEGLLTLTDEEDFLLFRSTIFECLGLINRIKECL